MMVNIIKGIIKPNNEKVEIVKTFTMDNSKPAIISLLNKFAKDKNKKNYQIYDSSTIEEENKRLFNALLYSYNIDATKFEGTIEMYEEE